MPDHSKKIKSQFKSLFFLYAVFTSSGCTRSPEIEKDFFNKKDLTGWSASQMQYWSVEDSAIVGKAADDIPRNQFLWSRVKVKDFYLHVDVKLDSSDRNAGIQFRSAQINDYGQAYGYQADIGVNYGVNIWGTLYHEDGRGLLHTSDPSKTPFTKQRLESIRNTGIGQPHLDRSKWTDHFCYGRYWR